MKLDDPFFKRDPFPPINDDFKQQMEEMGDSTQKMADKAGKTVTKFAIGIVLINVFAFLLVVFGILFALRLFDVI